MIIGEIYKKYKHFINNFKKMGTYIYKLSIDDNGVITFGLIDNGKDIEKYILYVEELINYTKHKLPEKSVLNIIFYTYDIKRRELVKSLFNSDGKIASYMG
jgi:hypothetical protein